MAAIYTLALLVAATGGPGATTPTRDVIELAKIVKADEQTKWTAYRVLSFSNLAARAKQRVKGDVRFFVETLNRNSNRAEIRELNDNLWAVQTKELGWKQRDWNDMVAESPYHKGTMKGEAGDVVVLAFQTNTPIMRADAFVRQAWEPEWYTKLLNLPTKREELLKEYGLKADWPKEIQAIGIIPQSDVENNPRKVAYLQGSTNNRKSLDFWVTMNYEDTKGHNDSLRYPNYLECNYNAIAFELPNGLDGYYANAGGGGGVAKKDEITDKLVDRFKNSDSRMAGLVKQIPMRGGTDHVHDGQILLGMSCISCHDNGAQDLGMKLASFSQLKSSAVEMPKKYAGLYDNAKLVAHAERGQLRWSAALLSINGRTPDANQASWKKTFAEFDADVDLAKASVEVGTARPELLEKYIRSWLASNRDPLVEKLLKGRVTRVEFEQVYPTLRKMFQAHDERAANLSLAMSN